MKKMRKQLNLVIIGMLLVLGFMATYHMDMWIQNYDQTYVTYPNKYDIEITSSKAYSYLYYEPSSAKEISEEQIKTLINDPNMINLCKTFFFMEEKQAKRFLEKQINKVVVQNEVYGELYYFEPEVKNKTVNSYQIMFTKDFKNIYYGLRYETNVKDSYVETSESLLKEEDEESRKVVLDKIKDIIQKLQITTIDAFAPDSISVRMYSIIGQEENELKTYLVEDKQNKITICYDMQNDVMREFILGFDL